MKVLVTGANGLLGHHVVNELLSDGREIRILVRNVSDVFFDLHRVEVVLGSFADASTLDEALEGCDAVIHIAAMVSHTALDYQPYEAINVDGSIQLFRESIRMGVKAFVFISSSNTVGNGTSSSLLANEDYPCGFPFERSYYAQSKIAAESKLLELSKNQSIRLIIINPCFLIGAFDPKPSSGKLLLMGYKRRIMFVPKGGKNFVSAENVARVVCNALEKGRSGERYLAGGENMSFKNFYTLQSKIGSYQQWIIELPDWVLKTAGFIGDFMRAMGMESELSTVNVNQLLVQEYYTSDKATRELALDATDLSKSINQSLCWFKSQGKIS